MAQKVVTTLIDDISGDVAAETITFALDGKSYEVDLSEHNAGQLRAGLDPFVKVARRSGGQRVKASSGARGADDRERNQKIREWARGHGISVSERGRISTAVIEQYDRRTVSGPPALVPV